MDNRKPNGNVIKTNDHSIYRSFEVNSGFEYQVGYLLKVNLTMPNEAYELIFTDEPPVKELTKEAQCEILAEELLANFSMTTDSGLRGSLCCIADLIVDGKFTNVKWEGK